MKDRKGWVPVQSPMVVGLLEPTFVERWGYEVDRETVLAKLLAEATRNDPADIKPGDKEKPHSIIVRRHPKFGAYRKVAPALSEVLMSLPLYDEEKLVQDIHRGVVESYVRNIVAQQMGKEQERRLWTPLAPLPPAAIKSESWRGPWEVTDKKVVKTGTYCPATSGLDLWGDSEYEPARLVNEKSHVLYRVRYHNREQWVDAHKGLGGAFLVERANTFDWSCEEVAKKLMEAK